MKYAGAPLSEVPCTDRITTRDHDRIGQADLILFWFLILNEFVIRYLRTAVPLFEVFSFKAWIDWILLAYVLVRLVSTRFKLSGGVYIASLILVIVVSINLAVFGFNGLAASTLITILSPLSLFAFFAYLRRSYNDEAFARLSRQLRIFLNCFFLLNTPIIYMQIATGSFLMGPFLAINPTVFDQMDGLIGLNGVPVLNFVWIATILFNVEQSLSEKRPGPAVLAACQFAVIVHISIFNDDKMMGLTFATVGFGYVIVRLTRSGRLATGLLKKLTVAGAGLTALLALFSAGVSGISGSVLNVLQLFWYSAGSVPDPNNERGMLNYLAFSRYGAAGLGSGLATIDPNDRSIHLHLGINSASLLLIQGGVFFLFAVILLYASAAYAIVRWGGGFGLPIFLSVFAIVVMSAYASRPFDDQYLVISLCLIFLLFSLAGADQELGVKPIGSAWEPGLDR
jgi:hypothetical protein